MDSECNGCNLLKARVEELWKEVNTLKARVCSLEQIKAGFDQPAWQMGTPVGRTVRAQQRLPALPRLPRLKSLPASRVKRRKRLWPGADTRKTKRPCPDAEHLDSEAESEHDWYRRRADPTSVVPLRPQSPATRTLARPTENNDKVEDNLKATSSSDRGSEAETSKLSLSASVRRFSDRAEKPQEDQKRSLRVTRNKSRGVVDDEINWIPIETGYLAIRPRPEGHLGAELLAKWGADILVTLSESDEKTRRNQKLARLLKECAPTVEWRQLYLSILHSKTVKKLTEADIESLKYVDALLQD